MAVGDVGVGAPLYRRYATAPDTRTSHVPGFTFRRMISFTFLDLLQESRVDPRIRHGASVFVRSPRVAVERRDQDENILLGSLRDRYLMVRRWGIIRQSGWL